MISRIYVMPKKGNKGDAYLIDSKLSLAQITKLAEALTNPILETYYVNQSPKITGSFSYAIEIGFKPGVTDNVAHTVKEVAKDLLKLKTGFEVYTSKIYFVKEKNEIKVKEFAVTLYNPLIESARISKIKKQKMYLPMKAPKVVLKKRKPVINVSLKVPDEELIKIGKEGIKDGDGTRRGPLALDLASMKTIQGYFKKLKRSPTDIELESLAQTWSEHCKHTIFANPIDNIKDGLYKT